MACVFGNSSEVLKAACKRMEQLQYILIGVTVLPENKIIFPLIVLV